MTDILGFEIFDKNSYTNSEAFEFLSLFYGILYHDLLGRFLRKVSSIAAESHSYRLCEVEKGLYSSLKEFKKVETASSIEEADFWLNKAEPIDIAYGPSELHFTWRTNLADSHFDDLVNFFDADDHSMHAWSALPIEGFHFESTSVAVLSVDETLVQNLLGTRLLSMKGGRFRHSNVVNH